jgi:hypothetical protein
LPPHMATHEKFILLTKRWHVILFLQIEKHNILFLKFEFLEFCKWLEFVNTKATHKFLCLAGTHRRGKLSDHQKS